MHCAVALELAKPLGQRLLSDPTHHGEQFAVAERSDLEVAEHQRGPLAADKARRSFGRVIFGAHSGKSIGTFRCPSGEANPAGLALAW